MIPGTRWTRFLCRIGFHRTTLVHTPKQGTRIQCVNCGRSGPWHK